MSSFLTSLIYIYILVFLGEGCLGRGSIGEEKMRWISNPSYVTLEGSNYITMLRLYVTSIILPRIYARNKWCFRWESANQKGLPAEGSDRRRVLISGGADRDRVKRRWVKCCLVKCCRGQPSGRRLSKGWQCYESHIGEVILRGRPYKDLDSPTPIANFWGVALSMTYTRNTLTTIPRLFSFLLLFFFLVLSSS